MKAEIYEGILDSVELLPGIRLFYDRVKRSAPVGRCIHCNAVMLKDGDTIFSSNAVTDCYCNGRVR